MAKTSLRSGAWLWRPVSLTAAALALVVWAAASGCGTPDLPPILDSVADTNATNAATLLLHEGDSLQIKFPGTPDEDTQQTIRADGKITILNAGDVKVSGLTPDAAGQAILGAVGKQLKFQQVNVTVQSSAFIVYVTGAILKPGKLISDRPLTVFQAVIESGVEQDKSDLKAVKVIRTDANGRNTYKILNLNDTLTGVQDKPFTLKPYDTIVVPEKFSPF